MKAIYIFITFPDGSFLLVPIENFDKTHYNKKTKFFSCFDDVSVENISEFMAGGYKQNRHFILYEVERMIVETEVNMLIEKRKDKRA